MQNQLTPSQSNLQQSSNNLQQNSSNLQQSGVPSGLTNTTSLPNQLPSTNRLSVQSAETTTSGPSQTYLPQSSGITDWIWVVLFIPFIIAMVFVLLRRQVPVEQLVEEAEVAPAPSPAPQPEPKKPKQAKKTTRRQRSKSKK